MTIQEAAAALRARQVSSVELTGACLDRIRALQPTLNAFLTVTGESAMDRAAAMDRELAAGAARGPLHGIPIAVKDVFCTRGVATTCGSPLFAEYVPDHNAAVVDRLEDAGAVLLGKTGMHELAYGITSNNPHFGAVRNPWAADRIPGGSSGGSGAAVASGMAFMAMGSDTGGSIRIPASYCGAVGLKPSTGRVSRYGVLPLDFTLDHIGPLARSVRDVALTLNVLAGPDPRDESCSGAPVPGYLPAPEASIRGLRLGLPEGFFFDRIHPSVRSAVLGLAKTAESLGAEVRSVSLPDMNEINLIGRLVLFAEASTVMEPYLEDRSRFGADVLALLDQGRLIPATDYIQAQRLRRLAQQEFSAVWRGVNCLLLPTTPITAPPVGQDEVSIGEEDEDVRIASTRLVRPFNVLGLPALSMPCGLTESGLPAGAQIVGPAFEEARVLRVAAVLEDAIGPCPSPPGLE